MDDDLCSTFFIRGKKAGFEVDNDLLNSLLTYINNRLAEKQTIDYYYNRDSKKR